MIRRTQQICIWHNKKIHQQTLYLKHLKMHTKDKLFDNCAILAPNGAILGRCDRKRLDFYLNKNIATIISDNPLTIQLNFEPKGYDGANEPFATQGKPNHCVVCGATKDLTKHHVIPKFIFKHMPEHVKRFNSHDVLPLCWEHHQQYENKSREKRKQISKQYNIPLHGQKQKEETKHNTIVNLSRYLQNTKIPIERKQILLERLTCQLGYLPTEQQIQEISITKKKISTITFGEEFLKINVDYNAIGIEWRQHFIDSMKPKFMPEWWETNRVIVRD